MPFVKKCGSRRLRRNPLVLSLLFLPSLALADASASDADVTESSAWWQRAKKEMSVTWQSNQYELYVPLHTWHNPRAYSSEKRAGYNEQPWGLGAGKYRFDSDGNWQAWYAMAFLDSHSKVEPVVGYGYQKIWRPAEDWRLGAGLTAGLTARADYGYAPLPVVLPLVSVEYGRAALQTTYIPGGKGNGNVLFTWMRWQF